MVGPFSGPFGSSFTVVGSLRGPPRVASGPRLDWSDPTPRLDFTKILQSGRGVGGTLNTRASCGGYLVETLAGGAGLTL